MYQLVYQKFTVPDPLVCHSFLHRINISGVKIRPVLKQFMVFISWSRKHSQLIPAKIIIICENNYRCWLFSQNANQRCWTWFWINLEFWIYQCSKYTGALNKRRFWMYQGSEYAFDAEYVRVLDIPQSTCQGYTGLRICSWICLNMQKSSWVAFFTFTHCNPLSKGAINIFSIVAVSIWFFIFLDKMFLHSMFLDWML